jgi:hypothetical protein
LGRLVGLILFVLAIYVGITIYTEGVDGAFGGIFARFGDDRTDPQAAERATPVTERVEDRWRDYLDASERRLESVDDR